MKLNEKWNVSEKKAKALLEKIDSLNISLDDIEESFSQGGGKGGQKVNKTSNCVKLHHKPTGIRVSCQRERDRSTNRFIALRSLVEKLEQQQSSAKTKEELKIEKIRKQKKRRKRKSVQKQGEEALEN